MNNQEVSTTVSQVQGIARELNFLVGATSSFALMRRGIARILTQCPAVLNPVREPLRAEQVMLDELAVSLGSPRGDGRFGKSYPAYLRYKVLGKRNAMTTAHRLLAAQEPQNRGEWTAK